MKTSRLARQRNKRVKTSIRSALKTFNSEKNPENLKTVAKVLDKAALKNVIHKNKAARLKSRLAKTVASQTK